MAKGKDTAPSNDRKWYQLLGDGYRVAKSQYSWTPWALLATYVLTLALFISLIFITNSTIIWIIAAVLLPPMLTMVVFTRLVERSAYKQMEGMPGAAGAIISRIRRGWSYSEEPVRFNPRSQDLVYRLVGKPGIVLVTEGPTKRVAKLVEDEKKAAKRIAPNVPVHVINSGTDDDQVRLSQIRKQLKKFPKALTAREVSVVGMRYDTMQRNTLPIPKGIDPFKARPDRRAMRGR